MIDIEGFKTYMYEEELSKNTVESYLRGIREYAALYDEVTKPNYIEFKRILMEKVKPKTVNLRLCAVMKYCKYKDIPMTIKHIKTPKLTHIDNIITEEQYKRLTDGLRADGDIVNYARVQLLAKTGMRISEARKIRKKDLYAGKVDIHTKAHMRTIYFPASLLEDIKPYLDTLNDDDYILRNEYGRSKEKGNSLTTRGFAAALNKMAEKYGIPGEVMHPHAFRHFFAMQFIKRKNDISLLADLLGHGSVNVTQIYLKQSEEEQKHAVDSVVDW